jgi:hypothetical protein
MNCPSNGERGTIPADGNAAIAQGWKATGRVNDGDESHTYCLAGYLFWLDSCPPGTNRYMLMMWCMASVIS